MNFNIQPILQNETIALYPLQEEDFEELYITASDPKIWEQHPNKERWQREIFKIYFAGAIASGGAFKIIEKEKNAVIGSTRFYDYNSQENSILIGYTFYAVQYWGTGVNYQAKALMLDYIYQFVAMVHFHIGAENIRSQIAISRLGIKKSGEQQVSYYGEIPKLNFVYSLTKEEWVSDKEVKKY